MNEVFKPGDQKSYSITVQETDTAAFEEEGEVHPVYATFALARDAEWTCRLFVLAMKEDHEEGIGTYITVNHDSPALIGSAVQFIATVKKVEENAIICSHEAYSGDRLIAYGEQGQKILPKKKLNALFTQLKQA